MKSPNNLDKNHNTHKTASNDRGNWYARMHELPKKSENTKHKHKLNLSIFFRIWVTVALIVIIAGLVVFEQLFEHVEPTSKQVIEDTLVDTGKLLSSMLSKPLQTGQIYNASYQNQLDEAFKEIQAKNGIVPHRNRKFVNEETLNKMSTWFYQKTHSSFRVYVTNKKGIVIYDSLPKNHETKLDGLPNNKNAEGKDYSQWNDVYLTLKGNYGARSSRSDREDGTTTIMYVAQPIINKNGDLIGVVSIGKPVATILPYIHAARQRMMTTSLVIMLVSVLLAGIVAWWLQQSIALVTRYTRSLASTAKKPSFYLGQELNELTDTIEDMKNRLENKSYVTDYVHTLTHELKSPLTAIKASGELLADMDLEEEDRATLSQTINEQSQKLQSLIDRLLLLAKIEQPNFQLDTKPINVMIMLKSLLNNHKPNLKQRSLQVNFYHEKSSIIDGESYNKNFDLKNNKNTLNDSEGEIIQQAIDIEELISITSDTLINADEFWLAQALDNLVANAIHFADTEIKIVIKQEASACSNNQTIKRLQPSLKNSNLKTTNKNEKIKRYLSLQIFNDGKQIPEYAIEKVFDRYFSLSHQVKHAVSSTNKGTGLGLTLAKQVIEHHAGSINVYNISNRDNKNSASNDLAHKNSIIDYLDKNQINQQGVCLMVKLPLI